MGPTWAVETLFLREPDPGFVADDGKKVYDLHIYQHQHRLYLYGVTKKILSLTFDSLICAQLDHQSYLGCLQVDPVGFGYPKIFLN